MEKSLLKNLKVGKVLFMQLNLIGEEEIFSISLSKHILAGGIERKIIFW